MSVAQPGQPGSEPCRCRCVQSRYPQGRLEANWQHSPSSRPPAAPVELQKQQLHTAGCPSNSLQTILFKESRTMEQNWASARWRTRKQVTCRLWSHHLGISLWHCRSYFFMCEALKLPSRPVAWQLNHIFYDAAGDIVLFPHFWECSPSALLVCHHLLNLFTAHRNQYA